MLRSWKGTSTKLGFSLLIFPSKDFDMKLYELKRNTYFYLLDGDGNETFLLDHIDGAYSVCYPSFSENGKRYLVDSVVHFSASTPVMEVLNV
jgi:hypothetical protein